MIEPLSPLEAAVLDLLLSRDDEGYAALRAQLATVEVTSRRMTGAGLFTTLSVAPDSPKAPGTVGNPVGQDAAYEHEVYADIDGMDNGAGFLLWLDDGRMDRLEGHAYADRWPNEVKGFTVRWRYVDR